MGVKKLFIMVLVGSFLVSYPAAEKNGAEKNLNEVMEPMKQAIRERHLSKIEQLLDAGSSPNQLDRVVNAEDQKSLEVLKLLVRKGANLELVCDGKSILECAISGYSSIKKLKLLALLVNGIPIDFDKVRKCLREREEPFAPESNIGQAMRIHNGIVGSIIMEQVNIGARWKKILPGPIEEFLPNPKPIQLVGEYVCAYYDYEELEWNWWELPQKKLKLEPEPEFE